MADQHKVTDVIRRRPKKLGVDEGADFDERRKLILDNAARLIAESGYAHTTIGDIADVMGVSKPVIYHYYRNKDALIRAIFEESDRVCALGWSEIEADGAPGLERLKRLFMFHAEFATTDLGRCITKTSYQLLSAETREFKVSNEQDLRREFVRLINQGKKDGSIRQCQSKILTSNLLAIIANLAHIYSEDFRDLKQHLNETWLNLLEGLAPRSSL